MALLQLVREEDIQEESLQSYFQDFYRIVSVGERPSSRDDPGGPVKSTYIVDWEQLVHLLEDYTVFGEDIVEVTVLSPAEAAILAHAGTAQIARA